MPSTNLRELPDEFWELSHLEILGLHGNRLTTLPAGIGRLSNLQDLDVSYNELTALPPTMKYLHNLRELVLDGNNLVALPTDLGTLPHLEVIAADNMPSLRFPPPEIIEEGHTAVVTYLREQHGEDTRHHAECCVKTQLGNLNKKYPG